MLKSERKQVILEKVHQEKFVRLEELTVLLDSSESTIRRDLDELELAGKLRRVHGGAESLAGLRMEESIQQKSVKNVQSKEALSIFAKDLIEDSDVIFLDAGTTTELLIPFLVDKDITVVTNSIHHAAKLVESQIPTMIVGGMVKASTDASIGAVAVEQIRRLNFDKAFLGMNAVDECDYTTPDMEEAIIKRTVLENSKTPYILLDASKIGQKSFVKVAPVHQASLITNATDSQLLQKIKKKTKVIEV
ncbi:DeoR/GlpR family DNA-binding transcription regulator [Streptococcus gallolyticus]|nr:DeoR/GlpR family DNA-binding transcription regulator [Streptococcus gallolyticus]MBY5041878.1 DeoR/GlpR family DNA-binding transcription regulator [Streptococcus gallolyticus]